MHAYASAQVEGTFLHVSAQVVLGGTATEVAAEPQMLSWLICGCCEWPGDDAGEELANANVVSLDAKRKVGGIVVSGRHCAGEGQVLAQQSVVQDRAYWEVVIEKCDESAPSLAVGVVAANHNFGKASLLKDTKTAWVLQSTELKALRPGDVLGVALNQSDYPVSLRFFLNGKLCRELVGPSTEPTPVLHLKTAHTAVVVNFGATAFAQQPPSGYLGLMKSRSIL